MPVAWNNGQHERVVDLIARHPVAGGQCANLARGVLPVARELDVDAAGIVVRPLTNQTRYACIRPRAAGLWWFHHVTIGVAKHCVDALTGPHGTPREVYLESHFDNETGDLYFDGTDPDLVDPCL